MKLERRLILSCTCVRFDLDGKKKADVFKCCPMLSVSWKNRIKIIFFNGD